MSRAMLATRLPVLLYHRVGATEGGFADRYCVEPDVFRGHMDALASKGMQACPINLFLAWLDKGETLPHGSFLLTFDDGYQGIHQFAAPILEALRWPSVVFLVSGLIGRLASWESQKTPGPGHRLLSVTEIRELQRAGFSFQSHSRHHSDLTTLNDSELAQEVGGSKRDLEGILDSEIHSFAYPFGRCDERVLYAVRSAGYRAAFSVESGFNRPECNPFRIRRIDVFGHDTPRQLLRKVTLGTNDGSMRELIGYYARRLRTVRFTTTKDSS